MPNHNTVNPKDQLLAKKLFGARMIITSTSSGGGGGNGNPGTGNYTETSNTIGATWVVSGFI